MAVLLLAHAQTRSRTAALPRSGGAVATWLAVVAGALLMVGFVSQTVLRHVIQIAPLVAAVGLVVRRSTIGVSAAAPLFAFWLLMMGAIWLFLLGLARIFTGTFTPIEVTLTIVIGAASVLGLRQAHHVSATRLRAGNVATVVVFAVLQLAAFWLSVQPFARR